MREAASEATGFVNASWFHNSISKTRRSAFAAWDDLPWRCAALAVSKHYHGGQAVKRSALVRRKHPSENRQTSSDVSFLLLHEMLQLATEHDWVAADASQAGFGNRLREWSAHLGVDTTLGYWACMSVWVDGAPFSAKASDSVFLLTWRLLTGSHRNRHWIFEVNKRRLCACGCFGRHTFQVLAWSFRALLSGRYPRHDHKGEPSAPSSWRGKVAGQSLRIRRMCLAKTGGWAWLERVVGLLWGGMTVHVAHVAGCATPGSLQVRTTTRVWLRSGGLLLSTRWLSGRS